MVKRYITIEARARDGAQLNQVSLFLLSRLFYLYKLDRSVFYSSDRSFSLYLGGNSPLLLEKV